MFSGARDQARAARSSITRTTEVNPTLLPGPEHPLIGYWSPRIGSLRSSDILLDPTGPVAITRNRVRAGLPRRHQRTPSRRPVVADRSGPGRPASRGSGPKAQGPVQGRCRVEVNRGASGAQRLGQGWSRALCWFNR